MSKNTRGPNFCSNEKEILIHLVTKYKDIVENKKTDAINTNIKNEGWQKLTEEFNALSSFCGRNSAQLKTCWDNIKRNARKEKATVKKQTLLTGGGRPNLPPPGLSQGLVEILLGPTLDGLHNAFDSDAQFWNEGVPKTKLISTSKTVENELEVIVVENELAEPSDLCQSLKSSEGDHSNLLPEIQTTDQLSETTQSQRPRDECLNLAPEDTKKVWNSWSPAALKSKVSDVLINKKKDSPSWLRRRRPNASIHDKLLQSKLDLVEIMKKNSQAEAEMKQLILSEQLKQEKIKTETLELQLKKLKNDNINLKNT